MIAQWDETWARNRGAVCQCGCHQSEHVNGRESCFRCYYRRMPECSRFRPTRADVSTPTPAPPL